jgi:hypothetical protein
MKYLNLTKNIALIAVVSLVFMACKKAKVATPMGDAGQTLVKLLGGGTPASVAPKAIDFLPTPTNIVAVEVRRDVPNNTELMKPMTVTVLDDTAAVTAANASYIKLPEAWHTISGATKAGGVGGVYTVTFQPGEFSKSIIVTIPDATLFNPSAKYALGFKILTADQGAVLSTQKSIVVEIGAKNAYDGIYSVVSGWVQRYTGPGSPESGANTPGNLNGDLTGNADVTLTTVGAYTNEWANHNWAFLGNSGGIAGINNLRSTVDPATNLVTMAALGNATLHNWTGFTAGPWNVYDPATRTFRVAMTWVSTAPAYREYQIVLKYKGPR